MTEKNQRSTLVLDGKSLTLSQVAKHLADPAGRISLSKPAWRRVEQSSDFFDRVQRGKERCYGLNTNFGDLIGCNIPPEQQDVMQRHLVLSHSVGMRETLPIQTSRSIFVMRLNSIARGVSGLKPATVVYLLKLYNNQAYPEIFSTGSLGASGDLAPLSHLAAFAIGEGSGYWRGRRMKAKLIIRKLGLSPLTLGRKEGLSLVNGTAAMTAIGIEAITRMSLYLDTMLIGMCLMMKMARIPCSFLSAEAFRLKPHSGAIRIDAVLRSLIGEKKNKTEVCEQPPYSFRCAPFILSPLFESIEMVKRVLSIEANSANDNPVFLESSNTVYHGGHFHGHPVSVALDQLRIAAVHLSGVMDRQLDMILDKKRNPHLPPFLSIDVDSGFCGLEGAQYLVTSLHIENKILAHPVSLETLPANGNNQDYVSLGMQSALASSRMADNLRIILGVYLMAICQANLISKRAVKSLPLSKVLSEILKRYGKIYKDDIMLREKLVLLVDDECFIRCRSLCDDSFNYRGGVR